MLRRLLWPAGSLEESKSGHRGSRVAPHVPFPENRRESFFATPQGREQRRGLKLQCAERLHAQLPA